MSARQSTETDVTCRHGTHAPRDCPARVFALHGTTPPTCPVPADECVRSASCEDDDHTYSWPCVHAALPPAKEPCPHGKASPLNCGLCAGVDG